MSLSPDQSRKRIILIAENKIHITPTHFFILKKTNFPHQHFAFKAKDDFFWEIEILRFKNDDHILGVTVTNYTPQNISSFWTQTVKNDISALHFEKLEWEKFQPFLSMYIKNELGNIIY